MNAFNSFSAFFRRLRSGVRQDPVRDWLMILTLSLIALAGIIVWNVWAFGTVANGGAIGSSSTSATPVFDRTILDNIHTIVTNRAAEEAKYVTGPYRYADPSQ